MAGSILPCLPPLTEAACAQVAPPSGPRSIGICISLEFVDRAKYGHGWDGRLTGANADSNYYAGMLTAKWSRIPRLSWSVRVIQTARAKTASVAGAVLSAAELLRAGDLCVITFCGFGGQLPDLTGDEVDLMDDTWCLYDGQIRSDELYRLWKCFAPGVRLVVIADCCHSGKLSRLLKERYSQLVKELKEPDSTFSKSLQAVAGRNFGSQKRTIERSPGEIADRTPAQLGTESEAQNLQGLFAAFRELPDAYHASAYDAQKFHYDRLAATLPPRKRDTRDAIQASVLMLHAAREDQLALHLGKDGGFFTGLLRQNLDQATSYRHLIDAIRRQMPEGQKPVMELFPRTHPRFAEEKPFVAF